jgi:hypothetical protein
MKVGQKVDFSSNRGVDKTSKTQLNGLKFMLRIGHS